MSEKIMTLHPSPDKKGVNIDKRKYLMIKDAILSSIKRHNQIRFMPTLITSVKDILGDTFDGSISWYVTTVKLDLEAKGMIERIPKVSPQQLRLKS